MRRFRNSRRRPTGGGPAALAAASIVLLALSGVAGGAAAVGGPPRLEPAGGKGLRGVDGRLAPLVNAGAGGVVAARAAGLDVRGTRVRVIAESTNLAAAKASVTAVGGLVEQTYAHLIEALVPPSAIRTLARSAGVAESESAGAAHGARRRRGGCRYARRQLAVGGHHRRGREGRDHRRRLPGVAGRAARGNARERGLRRPAGRPARDRRGAGRARDGTRRAVDLAVHGLRSRSRERGAVRGRQRDHDRQPFDRLVGDESRRRHRRAWDAGWDRSRRPRPRGALGECRRQPRRG